MHVLTYECISCSYYGIGIDNRPIVSDGDGFQYSSSSASNDDYDDEPLLKNLCVLLCMSQIAPECARMCLRTLKMTTISWGSMSPDPPTVNDCRAAMFSTQLMTLAGTLTNQTLNIDEGSNVDVTGLYIY